MRKVWNTLALATTFLAMGLDPGRSTLFVQSHVPAHRGLSWLLECTTSFGELRRMTQFKDKSAKQGDTIRVGLYDYPVLMAADILLYNAKYVPVGEDQFQHLEITRDIAERFNNKFGEVFVIPEATSKQTEFINRQSGLRIRSLTDPTKKMSKSSDDQKSKINLSDTPEQAYKKIMSATTDSVGVVNFDWESQPGVTNLLQLLSLTSGLDQETVNAQWTGQTQYGSLKQAVAQSVSDFLANFSSRYDEISDDKLLGLLANSEREMSIIANQTLLRAQQAVGLRPRN